jgi:hypothetical protein
MNQLTVDIHLQPNEQQGLTEWMQSLSDQLPDLLQVVWLFGSKARGDSTPESDIDVLVVINSDDWRLRKQIHYCATDINLKYDTFISPCVWSVSHLREVAALGTHFYHNVQREHIDLLQALSH